MNRKRLSSIFQNNSLLFIVVFSTIFVIPMISGRIQEVFYNIAYSFIFLASVFSLEKRNRTLTAGAVLAFVLVWISQIFKLPQLFSISGLFTIIFFTLVISKLVAQIARSQQVDAAVIFEAINGYLLIGLTFSLFVGMVVRFDPHAFAINNQTGDLGPNIIYYTFVTMTTLGYGDIVPVSQSAKSLAMLISISGQMYVAILIALLVGKYSASKK